MSTGAVEHEHDALPRLCQEQWLKLLDMADDIRRFIQENEGKLKKKE